MKRILQLLIGALIIYGCTQEIMVLENFNFSFEETHKESGYVLDSTPSIIKIKPEHIVDDTEYYFSYVLKKGDGNFFIDGNKIEQNTPYTLNKFDFIANFFSNKKGVNEIELILSDNKGNEHKKEIAYEIAYAPFSFSLNTTVEDYPVGAETPFLLTVINEEKGLQNFKVNYAVDNGEGHFCIKDDNNQTQAKPSNKDVDFTEGTQKWFYLPNNLGEHKVKIVAKNKDGNQIERNLTLKVRPIDFKWEITTTKTKTKVNENVPVSIELKTLDKNVDNSYTYFYEILNNDGDLLDNKGRKLIAGKYQKIEEGSKDFIFEPNSEGETKIRITAKDKYNQIKKDSIIIAVSTLNFNIKASSDKSKMYINERANITTALNVFNENTSGVNYNLSYELTKGEGELFLNDKIFKGSTKIGKEDIDFGYQPTEAGEHQLVFSVTDNYGQIKKDTLDLKVDFVDFNIQCYTNKNTLFVNRKLDIRTVFNTFSQVNNDYILTYEITKGEGNILLDNATFVGSKLIKKGEYDFAYQPTVEGEHEIIFYVKDAYGQVRTDTVRLNAKQEKFTFDILSNSNVDVTEPINVTFDINSDNPEMKYQMSLSVTGGQGVFKDNEKTVNLGKFKNLDNTDFTYFYTPKTVGVHTIKAIVKDENGQTIEKTTKIEVNKVDFEFNATSLSPVTLVTVESPISVYLIPKGGNATFKLFYEIIDGQGSLYKDNNPIPQGQPISVEAGNWFYQFKPELVSEKTTIKFKVVNSYDVVVQDEVYIKVRNVDFDFSANYPNKIEVNKQGKFNLNLSSEDNVENIKYYLSYSLINGQGNFRDSSNGVIAQNQKIDYELGRKDLYFTPTGNTGEYTVDFKITTNTGAEKHFIYKFNVTKTTYSLNVTPSSGTVYDGKKVDFKVTVLKNGVEDNNISYNTRFVKASGYITNFYYQNNYALNRQHLVNSSAVSYGSFIPRKSSVSHLGYKFTVVVVVDGTTLEKSCFYSLGTAPDNTTYSFSAVTTKPISMVNENVPINFNITKSGGSTNLTYKMSYTSTGNGSVKIGNNTYSAGQQFTVNGGAFTGSYKGTTDGSHSVDFKVSSSNGIDKSANVNITFNKDTSSGNTELNFSAISTLSTANVNTEIPVNFILSDNSSGNVTYKMYFTSSGNGKIKIGNNTYSAGQQFTITKGNFSGKYIGSNSGNHNVNFKVIASNNTTKESDISIDITEPLANNFNIDANFDNDKIDANTDNNLNINISESGSTSDYKISYSIISGNPLVKDVVENKNTGVWYDISKGSTTWKVQSNDDVNIKLSIKNKDGIIKTKEVNYTVNKTTFDVYTTPSISFRRYSSSNFEYDIITNGSENLTYQFKYETDNSVTLKDSNNNILDQIRYYDINKLKDILYTFAGEVGSDNIKLTFKASNGLTVVKNVSVTVNEYLPVASYKLKPYKISNSFNGMYVSTELEITALELGYDRSEQFIEAEIINTYNNERVTIPLSLSSYMSSTTNNYETIRPSNFRYIECNSRVLSNCLIRDVIRIRLKTSSGLYTVWSTVEH